MYLAHHRSETFPHAIEFRPERFLERTFSPYEYLPFGGANRRCLGMAFAQYELKLVLATILTQVDLALVTSEPVVPLRRGVTLSPSPNLSLVVRGTAG